MLTIAPSRREVQDLERRKALRRKKRIAQQKAEERERHERMMQIMEKNPQLAVGYQVGQNFSPTTGGTQQGGVPPQPDNSGNPYAPNGGSQRY